MFNSVCLRDGQLENLWGGGGRSTKKKYSHKGKLNEKKVHARQLTLKKYLCYGLKNIHTRNLIAKKIPAAQPPSPPPPITFLMVRPVVDTINKVP